MLKLLKYILLMTFFVVAPAAARAGSAIDKVCKDAVRTYRVDGEPGLTYNWMLTDISGTTVLNSPGVIVSDGGEITIAWTFGLGTYSLSVEKTSKFGCPIDTLGTIEVVPVPVVDAGPDQLVCAGKLISLSDATVLNLTPSGLEWTTSGDGTFTDPFGVNPDYTPGTKDLLAGKVILKLTAKSPDDGDGCLQEDEIEITIVPLPVLVINNPDPACEPGVVDLTDGAITLGSIIPPASVFSYWKDAAATVSLINPDQVTKSGTYYIKLDVNGLCPVIQPVNVVVNPALVFVVHDPPEVCNPTKIDLSLPFITAGSDPLLTYEYYSDVNGTVKLPGAIVSVGGTYYIKAITPADCANILPVNVVINLPVAPFFDLKYEYCQSSVAPILPGSSNNSPAIPGTWSPSLVDMSKLGPAKYTFTPDPSQCALPYEIVITITDHIHSKFNPIGPFCVGSPATLPLTSTNGITGTWSPSTIPTAVSGTFTYKFTPDADQCALDTTLQIQVNDPVTPSFDPIEACQNTFTNPLPAKSKEGISGTWSPAYSSAIIGPATYKFTPNADQCANPVNLTIIIHPEKIPVFAPIGPFCVNSVPTLLPSSDLNGLSGTWTPAVISTSTMGTNNYLFTPANGTCGKPVSIPITIIGLSLSATTVELGYSTLPIGEINLTVNGGSGHFSYSWTGPNGFTASTEDLVGLALGDYAVLVTDIETTCTETKTIKIRNNFLVDYNWDPVSCFGRADGSAKATPSGGTPPYHYSWKKDGLEVSTNQTATGLVAGNYTLEATDNLGLGMPKPAEFTITQPERLRILTTVKDVCFGANNGAISVKVSGGPTGAETVIWINGMKTNSLTGLPKGPYVIHIENICGRDTVVNINELPIMTLKANGTNPECFGAQGNIQLSLTKVPDGIYEVIYYGGQFSGVKVLNNSANIPAMGGTYKSLGILVNGCLVSGNDVTLTDPPKIHTASVTAQPTCIDATGTIRLSSVSSPGLTYSIDGTDFTNTTGIFSGLPSGDYIGFVKNSLGCISPSNKVTINDQPLPPTKPIARATTQPNCKEVGGSITVISPKGPGFTYSIDGVTFTNTTGVFKNLSSGDYQITVQIPGNCISVLSDKVTIIEQPVTPAAPTAKPVLPECEQNPIQTIYARSGIETPPAGISINWYDESGNSVRDPFLNKIGTVTYYAESSNGICISSNRTAVTLTILAMPVAPVSSGDISVCESEMPITLDARDAISSPSKTIRWFRMFTGGIPEISPTLSTVGTVTYFAEDYNGVCTSSPRTSVKLTIYKLPANPEAMVTTAPSCKDEHGVIEITSPIGPEYEYRIDGGAYQASVIFTELISKTYTLQARNINSGCESASVAFVLPAIPPEPIMKSATAVDCLCFGGDGSINFEFENVADNSYVIIYEGGSFQNVLVKDNKANVVVNAGIYMILAIEANGCTSTQDLSVIVREPDRISTSAVITEIDLKSGQKGEIDLTISGGIPDAGVYQTIWTPNLSNGFAGASTEDLKGLDDGDYLVTVTDKNGCLTNMTVTIPIANQPPVATNDEFDAGCGGVTGDLLYTDNGFGVDSDPDLDAFSIDTTAISKPTHGFLTLNPDGTFAYQAVQGFTGDDSFKYVINDVKKNQSNPATVTIHVVSDFDCDGIVDDLDTDADGDGILNADEGGKIVDTDGDGHPNWLDIDDDNDGIVDNIEAQRYSTGYIPPSGKHSDDDGLDDAYDTEMGNPNINPVDTDMDGIPDFLDPDSDNDLVPDYIEGHDGNDADGIPEHVLVGKDNDADGLDDGFDTMNRYKSPLENMTGSNSPLQDFDGDGMHDWRDENDDDDKYITRFEDLNADNDFSNDDTDFDGHPEYLDFGRDCDMFIPEAFSPNDDNIHEYFQIFCIDNFPDAKMYIFDQLGNKLFEKANYGNLNVWDTPERAWWDGRTTNRSATTINGKVTPGTYFYVLKLGNGEVKKSFVFVSY